MAKILCINLKGYRLQMTSNKLEIHIPRINVTNMLCLHLSSNSLLLLGDYVLSSCGRRCGNRRSLLCTYVSLNKV